MRRKRDPIITERDNLRRIVDQLNSMHRPMRDHEGVKRCSECVGGYDPQTAELVFAIYPCPTAAVLETETWQ